MRNIAMVVVATAVVALCGIAVIITPLLYKPDRVVIPLQIGGKTYTLEATVESVVTTRSLKADKSVMYDAEAAGDLADYDEAMGRNLTSGHMFAGKK